MNPQQKLLVAVCLGLFTMAAHAFTVLRLEFFLLDLKEFDPNHEEITSIGVRDPQIRANVFIKRTGGSVGFAREAIEEIQEANRLADSNEGDDPITHFDAETGYAASYRLVQARERIVRHAKDREYISARMLLGRSLHTLQDFYAHTNWVNRQGPIPHPDIGIAAFDNASSSATCDADGLLPGAELTSGYFDLTQLTGSSFANIPPINIYNWPADRCFHGSSFISSSSFRGKGINKDKVDRDGFSEAKTAAIASTTKFANLILSDLAGFDDAICGLLGQENAAACAGGPQTVTVMVPITFSGWSGMPANIILTDFTPRTIADFRASGNSATCGTGERGIPYFTQYLPANAVLFGSATSAGVPFQTAGPGVNRRNCSSFFAYAFVSHPTDSTQAPRLRVWINGTGRGQQFVSGGPTRDWESQVRYDSGDPFTGQGRVCTGGTVANAGFHSLAWTSTACSHTVKYF